MKRVAVLLLFLLMAGCVEGYGEASEAVDNAFFVAIGLREPTPTPIPTATPEPTATPAGGPSGDGPPNGGIEAPGYSPGLPTDKFEWAEELGCGAADPKNDEFVRSCISWFRSELRYSWSFNEWLGTHPEWADMNIWGQQNRYATYLWEIRSAELYGCEETECRDETGCHASGTQWETDALNEVYCCEGGMALRCPLDMGQICAGLECRRDDSWNGDRPTSTTVWSDCFMPSCLVDGECLADGSVTGLVYCHEGNPVKCTEMRMGVGVGQNDGYKCGLQGSDLAWVKCPMCYEREGDQCTYEGQNYDCTVVGNSYTWVLEE